ncbi:MAG: hypothetical protein ACHQ53_14065 [Polyangiales bacterium]
MASASHILPFCVLSLSVAACGATAPSSSGSKSSSKSSSTKRVADTSDSGLDLSQFGPGDAQVGADVGSDECNDLIAHDKPTAGDTTPFTIPTGETYGCFYFQSPFTDEVQGTGFGAVIDNSRVLHHWLLYDLRSVHDDGDVQRCLGTHPDAAVLSGWAPGAADTHFPANIGMAIPWGPDGRFVLEVHYVNNTGTTQSDRSGARICATHTPRPHTAALTWLGTENIGGPMGIPPGETTTVSGTCTPARAGYPADQLIHTLTVLPHMHKLGRHMQILVHRSGGTTDVLADHDFDYNNQVGFDMLGEVYEGDTLETRCTYDNTTDHSVPYGPTTAQEMCYAFAIGYPAGALDHPLPSFAGAQNTCLY